MLTFLAGAEIDPVSLRRYWKASVSIGVVSFALPFLGVFAFCHYVLGWHLHSAEIGGIALSTTSVAVVYAVMVETGLNREDIGKLILAACFITDLGTVLALGGSSLRMGGFSFSSPRSLSSPCSSSRRSCAPPLSISDTG
jgi:Kef-type K+ transport system membrane component KefB